MHHYHLETFTTYKAFKFVLLGRVADFIFISSRFKGALYHIKFTNLKYCSDLAALKLLKCYKKYHIKSIMLRCLKMLKPFSFIFLVSILKTIDPTTLTVKIWLCVCAFWNLKIYIETLQSLIQSQHKTWENI